jgi:nitroreductase
MEDYGYCMEMNILMATSLGLGTCWLGGTLERSAFAARLNTAGNEIIPAITPIGYSSDKKTLRGQALEFITRSSKRKLFGEIFYNYDYGNPLNEDECGKYTDVLDCVRLAPSAGNMQPWRVVKEKGVSTFHFYQKELVSYNNNKRYEGARLQNVDMGIAMCHFELAAAELGLKGNWEKSDTVRTLEGLNYIASWNGQ